MGHIEFEGWNVEIDDIKTLNRSPEVSRMRLIFEQHANLICASARGNVSAYYIILVEVKRRLISGSFIVNVTLSTGEERKIVLWPDYVNENDEDITRLIR